VSRVRLIVRISLSPACIGNGIDRTVEHSSIDIFRTPCKTHNFCLKVTLIPVQPNLGNPFPFQNRLDARRSSKPADEKICGRRVTVDNGKPHKIADGGAVALWPDEFCQGLHEGTEILSSDSNRLIESPAIAVNSVESCNSNEEFHHALKRKLLFCTNTGSMFALLYACADTPIEAVCNCGECSLEAGSVDLSSVGTLQENCTNKHREKE
jgi:hypothetical protein